MTSNNLENNILERIQTIKDMNSKDLTKEEIDQIEQDVNLLFTKSQ